MGELCHRQVRRPDERWRMTHRTHLTLLRWLSVPDAANYLSLEVGERITEATLLRLALDGVFRLSVYLPSPVRARCLHDDDLSSLPATEMIDGVWKLRLTGAGRLQIE